MTQYFCMAHTSQLVVQKNKVQNDLQTYWPFRDEIAIRDQTVIKARTIVIPSSVQDNTINQLHINHMSIEKEKIARISVHRMNMNANMEIAVNSCVIYLEYHYTYPNNKVISYEK